MHGFAWGLGAGVLISALAATLAGLWAYRRLILLERRARHAERLAELGTLTGGLAHEIKNPLSTIGLNLQLLEEDLAPDSAAAARVSNRLHIVQREASRLREILDDFLRFAGKIELNCEAIDLNALIEELADFFAPQAQTGHVQVRVKKSDQQVIAHVDANLVKQAVLNLMLNAFQAMLPQAGGELILSASPHGLRSAQAVIDVIDTGPGIPRDALDRIFQAYYSTKPSGTGLGLAMARRIIEEHGGWIDVASEVGKGTCVSIHLPR